MLCCEWNFVYRITSNVTEVTKNTEVYKKSTLSKTRSCESENVLKSGRDVVEDMTCSDRSRTSSSEFNINKMKVMVIENYQLSFTNIFSVCRIMFEKANSLKKARLVEPSVTRGFCIRITHHLTRLLL